MKAIFSLLLLLGCLTGLLVADGASDIAKVTIACMTENGVTSDDINKLKSGAVSPDDVSDNVKCASQCIFVKSGFMDAQGNLLTENIEKKFPGAMDSKMAESLSECTSVKGANPCDTAFKMMTCIESKSHAVVSKLGS